MGAILGGFDSAFIHGSVTSKDKGATWSLNSVLPPDVRGVASNNNIAVAITSPFPLSPHCIYYSTDGVNWVASTSDVDAFSEEISAAGYGCVYWSGTHFYVNPAINIYNATPRHPLLIRSADGINWTTILWSDDTISGSGTFHGNAGGVVVNDNTIIMVGNYFDITTNGASGYVISTDGGATWSTDYFHLWDVPSKTAGPITYAFGKYIVGVGEQGSDSAVGTPILLVSSDGNTWTGLNSPFSDMNDSTTDGTGYGQVNNFHFDGNTLVVVGHTPHNNGTYSDRTVAYTTDLANFTVASTPFDGRVFDTGNNRYYYPLAQGVVKDQGTWIVGGWKLVSDTPRTVKSAMHSTDLTTWTLDTSSGFDDFSAYVNDIAPTPYGPVNMLAGGSPPAAARYIAGGSGPTVISKMTALDGTSWQGLVTPFDGGSVNDIFASHIHFNPVVSGFYYSTPTLWVAVGHDAANTHAVMTSVDGESWTQVSTPLNGGVGTCVAYSASLGLWAVGGLTGGGAQRIITSSDGITWSLVTTPLDGTGGSINDINFCYGGYTEFPTANFIAVGTTADNSVKCICSTNGTSWTQITSDYDGTSSVFNAVSDTSQTGQAVYIVGDGPSTYYSLNGPSGLSFNPAIANPFDSGVIYDIGRPFFGEGTILCGKPGLGTVFSQTGNETLPTGTDYTSGGINCVSTGALSGYLTAKITVGVSAPATIHAQLVVEVGATFEVLAEVTQALTTNATLTIATDILLPGSTNNVTIWAASSTGTAVSIGTPGNPHTYFATNSVPSSTVVITNPSYVTPTWQPFTDVEVGLTSAKAVSVGLQPTQNWFDIQEQPICIVGTGATPDITGATPNTVLSPAVNSGGPFPDVGGWTEATTNIATPNTVYGYPYAGTLLSSSDGGLTWRAAENPFDQQASAGSYAVFDIAYNGTTWVAVGQGPYYQSNYHNHPVSVITSTDGVNWTAVTGLPFLIAYSAFWTGQYFVIGVYGSPNGIYYSSDGTTWHLASTPSSSVIQGFCMLGSTVFAFQQLGPGVYKSLDGGVTWINAGTMPGSLNSYGGVSTHSLIASNGSNKIVVAPNSSTPGQLFTSSDGSSWSTTSIPQWATLQGATPGNSIYETTNALSSWTAASVNALTEMLQIVWNGSEYMAIPGGFGGGSNIVWTSTDGLTWTGRGSGTTTFPYSIAWDGTAWVGLGTDIFSSQCMRSTNNGNTWTIASAPFPATSAIIGSDGAGNIVGFGGQSHNFVLATTSESAWPTWTVRPTPIDSVENILPLPNSPICFGGGRWIIAVGLNKLLTSTDRVNWTLVSTPLPLQGAWNGVTYNTHTNTWIIVGTTKKASAIATSPDGLTWTMHTCPNIGTLDSVGANLSGYLASGRYAKTILFSSDGANWQIIPSGPNNPYGYTTWSIGTNNSTPWIVGGIPIPTTVNTRVVGFNNNTWYVSGLPLGTQGYSTIVSSSDLVTWNIEPNPWDLAQNINPLSFGVKGSNSFIGGSNIDADGTSAILRATPNWVPNPSGFDFQGDFPNTYSTNLPKTFWPSISYLPASSFSRTTSDSMTLSDAAMAIVIPAPTAPVIGPGEHLTLPLSSDIFHISAPQLIRWRSRYRGQRESYKINLEMQQFLYDVRRLYESVGAADIVLTDYLETIEYGGTTNIDDGSHVPIVLNGNDDIIRRLARLLDRVEALEDGAEGLIYDNPLDYDSSPPYNA